MIVFLRDEMADNHADTMCCAIKTNHVEFLAGRIEIIYPHDGDITQIDVVRDPDNRDLFFQWGGIYDFCILYDDEDRYMLEEEFPNCKWYVE